MSYEIFYGLELIKQGGRFYPVVLHGSNNCFGYGRDGRQKRERNYSSCAVFSDSTGHLFTRSGADSFSSVEEFAADWNTPMMQKHKMDGVHYRIPITYAGVQKHFQPKISKYAALFPEREESKAEVARVNEKPPHIWEEGSMVSEPSSIYYAKGISDDDKDRFMQAWKQWEARPKRMLLDGEEARKVMAAYLDFLQFSPETRAAIEAYHAEKWMGKSIIPFHLMPTVYELYSEVV